MNQKLKTNYPILSNYELLNNEEMIEINSLLIKGRNMNSILTIKELFNKNEELNNFNDDLDIPEEEPLFLENKYEKDNIKNENDDYEYI